MSEFSGAIPVNINVTGRQIHLAEHSALFLYKLCDVVTVQGSQQKFQLAIAQRDLEQALAALPPLDPQHDQKHEPAPLNRRERRAVEQASKNGTQERDEPFA